MEDSAVADALQSLWEIAQANPYQKKKSWSLAEGQVEGLEKVAHPRMRGTELLLSQEAPETLS